MAGTALDVWLRFHDNKSSVKSTINSRKSVRFLRNGRNGVNANYGVDTFRQGDEVPPRRIALHQRGEVAVDAERVGQHRDASRNKASREAKREKITSNVDFNAVSPQVHNDGLDRPGPHLRSPVGSTRHQPHRTGRGRLCKRIRKFHDLKVLVKTVKRYHR